MALAVTKVHAPVAGEEDPQATRVRWGPQLDVVPVTDADNGRGRAAAYLAKYSTKSSDGMGTLDHRLRAEVRVPLDLAPQLRRLVETAWELRTEARLEELHLRAWAHTLGFRGHFATKSRRYSTTFGALRALRQTWRVAQDKDDRGSGGRDSRGAGVFEIREWKVTGMGYRTPSDAWLAEGLAHTAREARRAMYEERMDQRGEAA